MKRLALWIVLFSMMTVMAVGIACLSPVIISRLKKPSVSEVTTPLSSEVVRGICQSFEMSETDQRCRVGVKVYAPDFFPVILAAFERGVSTRDDVIAKLGIYEYGCETPTHVPSLEITYYRCRYDLNGDHVFPVVISYTDNDVVWRMTATIGDD